VRTQEQILRRMVQQLDSNEYSIIQCLEVYYNNT